MFDKDGNYAPPDAATRHVLVVTQAHAGRLGQFSWPIPAGAVLEVAHMGHTNIAAGQGKQYRHPQAGAVWIEHATAKPGDVLPMDEVTSAVELAQKRREAVQAFWKAEREAVAKAQADGQAALAAHPPLTAEERAAVRALLAAKKGA